jgi:hypothetical protein
VIIALCAVVIALIIAGTADTDRDTPPESGTTASPSTKVAP